MQTKRLDIRGVDQETRDIIEDYQYQHRINKAEALKAIVKMAIVRGASGDMLEDDIFISQLVTEVREQVRDRFTAEFCELQDKEYSWESDISRALWKLRQSQDFCRASNMLLNKILTNLNTPFPIENKQIAKERKASLPERLSSSF